MAQSIENKKMGEILNKIITERYGNNISKFNQQDLEDIKAEVYKNIQETVQGITAAKRLSDFAMQSFFYRTYDVLGSHSDIQLKFQGFVLNELGVITNDKIDWGVIMKAFFYTLAMFYPDLFYYCLYQFDSPALFQVWEEYNSLS